MGWDFGVESLKCYLTLYFVGADVFCYGVLGVSDWELFGLSVVLLDLSELLLFWISSKRALDFYNSRWLYLIFLKSY